MGNMLEMGQADREREGSQESGREPGRPPPAQDGCVVRSGTLSEFRNRMLRSFL